MRHALLFFPLGSGLGGSGVGHVDEVLDGNEPEEVVLGEVPGDDVHEVAVLDGDLLEAETLEEAELEDEELVGDAVDGKMEALQEPARAVRTILKRNCLQFRDHASEAR